MNPDKPRDRPWDDARAVPPMTPQQLADDMLREDRARRGLVHHSGWLSGYISGLIRRDAQLDRRTIQTVGDGKYRLQVTVQGRLHNIDVYACPVQMRADLDAMKAARDAVNEGGE